MNCNCGNHDHHVKQKTKAEIIEETRKAGLDLEAEYELIKKKESKLSSMDRKRIVLFMENYKDE